MIEVQTSSNGAEIINLLLIGLQEIEHLVPILLKQAALDHVAAVKFRIQNRGLDSEGNRMATQSAKQLGAYSASHGRRRQKTGRQVNIIDWTLTGELMDDFQVFPAEIEPGLVVVKAGFATPELAKRAEYLEAYFGRAFYPSEGEQRAIAEGVAQRLNQLTSR